MKKSTKRKLRVIPMIIANAAIVLGAVYILFYILDIFNPMFHFLDGHIIVTRYLDIAVAGLCMLLGILFIICTWALYTAPVKKKKKKKIRRPVEYDDEE